MVLATFDRMDWEARARNGSREALSDGFLGVWK